MSGPQFPNGPFMPGDNRGWMPIPGGPGDPSSAWANPQGTIPGPLVTWPQALYTAQATTLQFAPPNGLLAAVPDVVVPLGPPVFLRAIYSTPIFDLAAQLKSSSGVNPEGWTIARGESCGLYVEFDFVSGIGNTVYNVYVVERAHGWDAPKVTAIGPAQAQQQVMGDMVSATQWRPRLTFSPPPGVRFWQVYIIIDQTADVAAPVVRITPTCY